MQDPMGDRFRYPGHPYPEMCRQGLGHLWEGPRRNDFQPSLIQAAQKHLKKYNLPHERGDAIQYIRNLTLKGDWGALEQREDEAKVLSGAVDSQEAIALETVPAPKTLAEMDELEREKTLRAIEAVKQQLKGDRL